MNLYKEILRRFPRGGISYVFGYGSGVKQQIGYRPIEKQNDNVIDMMFCVRDPLGWHAENIERHPQHYSAMRFFGARNIMKYQENVGANVYFNTLVPLKDLDVTIKYGVVSREHIINDCLNWKHLYLAGRLQKPVQDVVPPTEDVELSDALAQNLVHAMQCSMLMLPEQFTDTELFTTISNLSYKGDFRMIFGENKQKVRNIVNAQQKDFLKLYEPAMRKLADFLAVDFNSQQRGDICKILFEQDKSQRANEHHLRNLPQQLRKRIVHNSAYRGNYSDIVTYLSTTNNLKEIVQVSVNDIVWRSSVLQSLKNIASAGIVKSIIYSFRKAKKTFENRLVINTNRIALPKMIETPPRTIMQKLVDIVDNQLTGLVRFVSDFDIGGKKK